ncbi:MAG: cytochrome c biogenesis protein CcdA [Thermoanaerobacteraceae bacterium]|nr:cytochrome c biogenesis protein CcdA [Thermoanaerobacteraceae bacterium]
MAPSEVSLLVALTAGVISFLSPCVIPLVPSYLTYLAGTSAAQLAHGVPGKVRLTLLVNALAFVAGFSAIFVTMGLSASAIGALLLKHLDWVQRVGGLIIILWGLHMAGVLKVGLLQQERRVKFKPGRAGIAGSFLMGLAFSAGWTPCVGPVLGSILILAANTASIGTGAVLLASYSLGMTLPFMAAAVGLEWVMGKLKRHTRWLPLVTTVSGWIMVIAGILVATGIFARLSGLGPLSF